MKIHSCRRCDGCGHIAGGYSWEVPWTRIAATTEEGERSPLRPQMCPDCGGTGALLELDAQSVTGPKFATRRGLPQNHYVHHVAALLRSQAFRARAN
jgi:hypothetical protein